MQSQKTDPFCLDSRRLKNENGVKVFRKKGKTTSTYLKIFTKENSYWVQREAHFLSLLSTLEYVQQYVTLQRTESVNNYKKISTRHAGVTIQDWIRVKNKQGYHPFYQPYEFLKLMRACIIALKELWQYKIVHFDIKADNICLPYIQKDNKKIACWEEAKDIRIDYNKIKIIDFGYSISHQAQDNLRLEKPLPQTGDYFSQQAKEALQSQDPMQQQQIDWRNDLYSLGCMFDLSNSKAISLKKSDDSYAIREEINNLIKELKNENADKNTPTHDILIARIDNLLINQTEHYFFDVASIAGLKEDKMKVKTVCGLVAFALVGGLALGVLFIPPYKDKIIEENIDAYRKEPAEDATSPNKPSITKDLKFVYKIKKKEITDYFNRIIETQIEPLSEPPINTPINVKNTTPATAGRIELNANAQKSSGGVTDNRPLNTHFDKEGVPPRYTTPYVSSNSSPDLPQSDDLPKLRTKQDIEQVFNWNAGKFNKIYQSYLNKDKTIMGKMVLSLEIDSNGNMTKCNIESSQLENKQLEEDILSLARNIKFESGNFSAWKGTHLLNFYWKYN